MICPNSFTRLGNKVVVGIGVGGGGRTSLLLEATTAVDAAMVTRGGGLEVREVAVAFLFFGRGIGVPVTPENKGGRGRASLPTKGGGDWPEPSPVPCYNQER